MDLYIIRHGKAGKSMADPTNDARRGLTDKGRAEIKLIARWMRKRGVTFNLIATSPFDRARETAEIVAAQFPTTPPVEIWESLAIPGDIQELQKSLSANQTLSSVLIVGHEPMLSQFAGTLTTDSGDLAIILGKGSIIKIRDLHGEESLRGDLEWLIPASLITDNQF